MGSRSVVAGLLESILPFAVLFAFVVFSCNVAETQQKPPSNRSFDRIAALAKEASKANDLANAIPLYRQALRLRPQWAEGWWSLGTILYDHDSYSDAGRAFRRVIALDPKHGTARVMLGLCEFELGQDANALRDIESGKQLGILKDPQFRRVMLYHEGVLLVRKGSFEAAQQALDSLSREGAQNDDLVLALGMSVLRIRPQGLPPEGSTAREMVLRAGKAEWLAASKNFDAARREYSSLATEYSNAANIHYAYGRFLLQVREIDPAVVQFQHEIQNNPQHVLARLQIAAVRYRLDSADGIKYAKGAVELAPQEPFGHYLLGLLYLDTGDFSRAISELEISKHAYSRVPDLYFALGAAYARAGRKQDAAQARAIFKRLSNRPTDESSNNSYGGRSSNLDPERLGHETGSHPQR